jgi:signal transduction histidine kinase
MPQSHLPEPADLERILAAWQEATDRLQRTHESLQAEVKRLTDELEQKNRELSRKNRLADLGHFASHIAHEVRNGLAPLTLYVSSLQRRLAHDELAAGMLGKLQAGFLAVDALVHDLLHFTADRTPQQAPFAISELVGEVLDFVQPQLASQNVHASTSAEQACTLLADRSMIKRALLNLVLNALDVMPQGGTLEIRAVPTHEGLALEVEDSGPGVDPTVAERLFDPFVTTKSTGTGLGLAIVQRVAEAHGGQAGVQSGRWGGALFTLELPQPVREAA